MSNNFVFAVLLSAMVFSLCCGSAAALTADDMLPSHEPTVTLTQDQDIMSKIAQKYKVKTEAWGDGLIGYSKTLFKVLLTIDVIMFGISAGLNVANNGKSLGQILGEFAMLVLLPAAFMYAVITYYQPWSQAIINGFSFIAGKVEPASAISSGSFFTAGLVLFDQLLSFVEWDSPSTWSLLLGAFIIMICYALMAMQVLLIKCESYIVLNAGIIILGLGAFNQTRGYAVNFIRYVLAVAVKLYVLQLIIGIAFSFVEDFAATKSPTDVAVIIGGSIVMLGLIRCIPDICAGIIQGQHVNTGNALTGAMATAGAMTMGMISGAAAVGGTANAVSTLAKAAAADSGNTAGNFVKGLAGAATDIVSGRGATTSIGHFNSKVSARAMGLGANSLESVDVSLKGLPSTLWKKYVSTALTRLLMRKMSA